MWINNIDYRYGYHKCNKVKISIAVCEESYTYIDRKTGQKVEKAGKFAWISFREITVRNVEKRRNNMDTHIPLIRLAKPDYLI